MILDNRPGVPGIQVAANAQKLVAQGTEPAPTTPQQLVQYIKADTARWAKIIKERNLVVQ